MQKKKSSTKSAGYFIFLEEPIRDRTVSKPPKGFSSKDWDMYVGLDVEITGTTYCIRGEQWIEACFTDGKMANECRWFREGELENWRQDAQTCSE